LGENWPDPITLGGPSAGSITIGNGDVLRELKPDSNGFYEGTEWTSTILGSWETGDTITASATGAELPPFTLQHVFPDKLSDAQWSQQPDGGTTSEIDHSNPVEYTWSAVDGDVGVSFWQWSDASQSSHEVACQFDGQAGAGTFPAEALSRLKTDPAMVTGTGIGRMVRQCITWKDHHLVFISVHANQHAVKVK